jgi:TMEM175 potassium channel family protein
VPAAGRRYEREGEGIAFERVGVFTDGVYAIALTLIVVGIGVPTLRDATDASELWHALGDRLPEFVSFLVGLGVIGFYWSSHHESFEQLAAVDRRYASWTVVYLGAVAFLPYPIRLVGSYADNPTAWAFFATNLALVSGLEAIMFAHSRRAGLLRVEQSPAEYRWNLLMSLTPVPAFVVSVPVAFVNPRAAPAVWALTLVVQVLAGRWRPDRPDGTRSRPPAPR